MLKLKYPVIKDRSAIHNYHVRLARMPASKVYIQQQIQIHSQLYEQNLFNLEFISACHTGFFLLFGHGRPSSAPSIMNTTKTARTQLNICIIHTFKSNRNIILRLLFISPSVFHLSELRSVCSLDCGRGRTSA